MPDTNIKTVTDRQLFLTIFNKLFLNREVFVKKGETVYPAAFLNYEAGISTLKIDPSYGPFTDVIVYINRATDVVFSHMRFTGDLGNGRVTFETIDIQIMEIPRREERFTVNEVKAEPSHAQAYVSGIISDFSVTSCLESSERRVEYLRQEFKKKLSAVYTFSDIVFLHDRKINPRMQFLQNERRPYFLPAIRKGRIPPEEADLQYYMTQIYPKDMHIEDNGLTSEICVPLLYRMMLPFGYIQVNRKEPLTEQDYSSVRKVGMSASTIFTNDPHIIKSASDIVAISDLSLKGLGILFKDKPLIKHFKDKSSIIFTVFLPEKRQATILASVRYITLIDNKIYKVGCEILNIDPIGEVQYEEYIESLAKGKPKQNDAPPAE